MKALLGSLILAVILASIGLSAPQTVVPWLPTLEWKHDTLHVGVAETGWALDARSWFPLILNRSGGYILYRFDTETDTLLSIIYDGGAGPYIPPVVIPAAVDSIFLTAEVAGTVYIEWWSE